jgi:hypothetical protein
MFLDFGAFPAALAAMLREDANAGLVRHADRPFAHPRSPSCVLLQLWLGIIFLPNFRGSRLPCELPRFVAWCDF